MTTRLSLIIPLLALGLSAQLAHGAQVLWGSARLAFNYVSTGEPNALGSDFTFQLGSFDPDFTPTADNISSWLAHWTPAQSVDYNANTRFFTGSYGRQAKVTQAQSGSWQPTPTGAGLRLLAASHHPCSGPWQTQKQWSLALSMPPTPLPICKQPRLTRHLSFSI